MKVLALDTSMGSCSAAVSQGGGPPGAPTAHTVLASREVPMARGHAEALLPMVQAVIAEADLDFAALDRIAATTGPGSFTGVRIAIAAARGFGIATQTRLWGTDSLSVAAARAVTAGLAGGDGKPFAVAMDAKRGMLYFGLYEASGRCLSGPSLLSPEQALALLPAELSAVLGSGGEILGQAAEAAGRSLAALAPDLQPNAAALSLLALEADEPTANLRPLYLRPPDAKPQTSKLQIGRVPTSDPLPAEISLKAPEAC